MVPSQLFSEVIVEDDDENGNENVGVYTSHNTFQSYNNPYT